MEDLMSQFTALSDQALRDKKFDPSTIEDLMKLFELDAHRSWAAMESECQKEAEEALTAMAEAEAELDAAMDDFRRFEEDMEREAMAEYRSLTNVGNAAWKMGQIWEKSATAASNKYIEAAVKSANNSVKFASKGTSSSKVHPS